LDRGIQIRLEYREDINHLPEGAGGGIAWACGPLGGRPGEPERCDEMTAMGRPHLQIVAMAFTIGPTPRRAE
jgi:hypothetical protein